MVRILTNPDTQTVTLEAPFLGISVTTEEFTQEVTVRKFSEKLVSCVVDELLPDKEMLNRCLKNRDYTEALRLVSEAMRLGFTVELHTENSANLFTLTPGAAPLYTEQFLSMAGFAARVGRPVTRVWLNRKLDTTTSMFRTSETGYRLISIDERTSDRMTILYAELTSSREQLVHDVCVSLSRYLSLMYGRYRDRLKETWQ